jgi:hypothetical protein
VRFFFVSLLVCWLGVPTWAQAGRELQKVLPTGAMVIETARLNLKSGKPRVLVLWMANRERVVRHRRDGYCGDNVYGDYWSGPARVSLVDSGRGMLINTIEVRSAPDGPDGAAGNFRVPFLVGSAYYHVVRPGRNREGPPRILWMRDLTGEGVRGQFVLFDYLACGVAATAVFGYSVRADKAAQFPVETVTSRHRPEISGWIPVVFGKKPVRPGYWRMTWEAGHGDMSRNHEEMSFHRERQLYVRKLKREAYPEYGEASCDLSLKKLSRFLELFKAHLGPGVTDSAVQELKRTAESLPPEDKRLDLPISVSYQGRKVELDIVLKRYKDGDFGMWMVTDREMAAQLQKLMDEVSR